jgi:hypothetical protein
MLSGTVERTAQIRGWGEWRHDSTVGLNPHEIKRYFVWSLGSWIACIVVDGYLVLNCFREYKRSVREMVRDFVTNWTVAQTIEKVGLFISVLSMVNLALDVYRNFNHLTADTSHYLWFTLCVMCKITRLLVQGEHYHNHF